MSPYRIELANPGDEEALQAILRATEMQGAIRLGFQRSPSFFEADRIGNQSCQPIIARREGGPVGLGARALRPLFVGGKSQPLGYLSGLRLLRAHRSGTLIARGYKMLRSLHGDGRARWYITTVLSDNAEAIRLLESGRASLPRYDFAGEFHTFVLPCPRRGNVSRPSPPVEPAPFLEAYQRLAMRRDLSPVVTADDFQPDGPWFGVQRDDLHVVPDGGGEPLATLAVWDQRAIRQTVVRGYSGWMKNLRWLINLVGPLRGLPRLPPPGARLEMIHGTLAAYGPGQHDCFVALVRRVVAQCAGRADSIVLGLPAEDPAAALLRTRGHHLIRSRVYQVWWPDNEAPSPSKLSPPGPCLDVATL